MLKITDEDLSNFNKFLQSSDSIYRTNLEGELKRSEDPKYLSIISYVNHGYERINRYLREQQSDKPKDPIVESHVKILNQALEQCPSVPNSILYRAEQSFRIKFSKKWFEERVGEIIIYPSYLSCSKERIRVEAIGHLIFEIFTCGQTSAFDINNHGGKKCEMESLFTPNSAFKILSVIDEGEKILIKLEETKILEGIRLINNEHYHLPKRDISKSGIPSLND